MKYRVYMSGRGLIHKSTKHCLLKILLPLQKLSSATEIVEEHCRIGIFMSGNYDLNLIETFTLLIF